MTSPRRLERGTITTKELEKARIVFQEETELLG